MALGDASTLFVSQSAEMINNPLAGAPVAPDPADQYLVAADFADVTDLPDDPTGDDLAAKLAAILAILKDPT
jgi:hypothetical protein